MAIPSLPSFYDMQFTKEGGRLTSDSYLYLDQQFQALNYVTFATNSTIPTYIQKSDENPFGLAPIPNPKTLVILGVTFPSFTTAQINIIATANNADGTPIVQVGTTWYNSTLKKLQFKADVATIETIQSV